MIFWFVFFGLEFIFQGLSYQLGLGVVNRGISFGLAEGMIPSLVFFVALSFLLILILTGKLKESGWWAILFGGVSNAISRIAFGGVVDYLHWTFGFDLWFNLADVAIVLGMLLTVYQIRTSHDKS